MGPTKLTSTSDVGHILKWFLPFTLHQIVYAASAYQILLENYKLTIEAIPAIPLANQFRLGVTCDLLCEIVHKHWDRCLL